MEEKIEKPRSIIRIGRRHAITSDRYCWKVCTVSPDRKTGEEKITAFSFHSTLAQAVRSLFDVLVKTGEYQSFKDLADNIDAIQKQFDKVLAPLGFKYVQVSDPLYTEGQKNRAKKCGKTFVSDIEDSPTANEDSDEESD